MNKETASVLAAVAPYLPPGRRRARSKDDVPPHVVEAMRERAAAKRARKAAMRLGERLEVAAILDARGHAWYVPRPGRHHDVYAKMRAGHALQRRNDLSAQGFLTSAGRFVDRKTAKKLARQAGQLLPRASGLSELFSEDVW